MGVPQPGAIQVQRQAVFSGKAVNLLHVLQRNDGAAGAVVRVLDQHQTGRREVVVVGAHAGLQLLDAEYAPLAG